MSSSFSQIDYSALLEDILGGKEKDTIGFELGHVGANFTNSDIVLCQAEIERTAEYFDSMYTEVENGLGSLKSIGKARISGKCQVATTTTPWEFQAWVPFVSKRVMSLKGARLTLHLVVYQGQVDVGILAEDSVSFMGDRYTAETGEHQIDFEVPGNEVKGLVICNGGTDSPASLVEIKDAELRHFDIESKPAREWTAALKQAENPCMPESDNPADLSATAPLIIFYLLQRGRFQEASLLIQAASKLIGSTPSWWPDRLDEFLANFLSLSRDIPPVRHADSSVELSEELNPLISEWGKLSPTFGGQTVVPLHFEILEAGLLLDLLGTTRGQKTIFEWKRSAVAAPMVQRGILSHLLRVLEERLEGDLTDFTLIISSAPEKISVTIQSDLRRGDLQYRHFSRAVVDLLQAFNTGEGGLPELKHDLGAENQLILEWSQTALLSKLTALRWETKPDSTTEIHTSDTGSRILHRGGLGYKYSPHNSSKRLSPREEITLLDKLTDLGACSTPVALATGENGSWVSYPFEHGTTLAAAHSNIAQRSEKNATIRALSDLVALINQRGVRHRDLRAENILITPDRRLALLDFDQAVAESSDDDFGNEWGEDRACAGFGGLLKQLGWEADFLRTAGRLGFAWELGRHSAANSPGKHACYYQWQWGPFRLEGERPWSTRWHLLRRAFTEGKGEFLELGSNLGLLSSYAALAGWDSTGLEKDGIAVESSRLIASALGSSAKFQQMDLQDRDAWPRWDKKYDLVSALSVVHWLPDPQPVEAFLSRQSRLLFEGHRSAAEEKKYLEGLGFSNVDLLGYSERLRPVLLASKN